MRPRRTTMRTGKKMKNRVKGKNNSKSDNSPQSRDKVIDDPQFSLVHIDPRFREAPKHQIKASIES